MKVRKPNLNDIKRMAERNQEFCDELNDLTSKCKILYDTIIVLLDENIKHYRNKIKYKNKVWEKPWSDERREEYNQRKMNNFKVRKDFIKKFYLEKEKSNEST